MTSDIARAAKWMRHHAEQLQPLQGREVGGMVADDILAVRFLLASIKIKHERQPDDLHKVQVAAR